MLDLDPPQPNVADLLSMAAAFAAIVALVLAGPPLPGVSARLAHLIDVVTVAGALFALAWQFAPATDADDLPRGTTLLFVLTMASELVGAALALLYPSRTVPGRDGYALRLLAGGLGTFAVTAVLAVHNRNHDLPWYATGAGTGYLVAALLIALASRGTLPAADHTGRRVLSGVWPALPFLPMALAIVEVTRLYLRTGGLSPVLMWVLLVSCGLAMLRQLITLVTIRRLLTSLDHQAHHDSLTELPNRAAFHAAANLELAAAGPRRLTGVLLLDLDGFKQVNDTLGHAAGDELLIGVARRCAAALRPADTVARLGGDEFVVLLPDLGAAELAERVAERLLDHLGEPLAVAGEQLRVRASIGIRVVTGGGHHLEEVLQDADTALYQAKAAGKGCFRLFAPPPRIARSAA
ncbi:diguanylate cyclase domain-containing protein [Micromonosporaceae bacterium Da 78-11]